MKMYEKLGMSTEDALKLVEECATRNCRECPAYKTQKFGDAATKCASKYLLLKVPEPPKIPRWKTARTQEDFDRLFDGFKKFCNGRLCDDCKYLDVFAQIGNGQKDCYHTYLSEFVEAPEGSFFTQWKKLSKL